MNATSPKELLTQLKAVPRELLPASDLKVMEECLGKVDSITQTRMVNDEVSSVLLEAIGLMNPGLVKILVEAADFRGVELPPAFHDPETPAITTPIDPTVLVVERLGFAMEGLADERVQKLLEILGVLVDAGFSSLETDAATFQNAWDRWVSTLDQDLDLFDFPEMVGYSVSVFELLLKAQGEVWYSKFRQALVDEDESVKGVREVLELEPTGQAWRAAIREELLEEKLASSSSISRGPRF